MRNTIKKGLTIAVSVMTAVWSVGISAFAPIAASAVSVAAEGDLVKASLPAVYYIGDNGKRYVFPNQKTYNTWYSDFSSVDTISDSELAAIAIGGNVTYRPGARLVKITTDPKVYMVGADAMLYAIDSEATALNLFGSNWNTLIDDVPDAFFTNYSVASGDVSAAALGLGGKLPVGTVVMMGSSYYFVGATQHYKLTGNTSVYTSVVKPSDETEFQSWMGVASNAITTSMDAMSLVTPDRTGTTEGGDGGDEGGTADGLSASVKTPSTSGFMTVVLSDNSNLAMAVVEVCSDEDVDLEELSISIGDNGTAGFSDLLLYAETESGHIYEVNGTTNNDDTALLSASDDEENISGCEDVNVYLGSDNQGAYVHLVLDGVDTNKGSIDVDSETVISRAAVPIDSSDILDVTFSSADAPSSLQSDGSKQKIFSIQAAIDSHDARIEYIALKVNGTLEASNWELRRDGTTISTEADKQGKFFIFSVDSAYQLFEKGSDTWEFWAEVDGEAGQTITPQFVWPAPMMHFWDNDRNVRVSPQITRIALSDTVDTTTSIEGASATIEVVNLENVTDGGNELDSDITTGATDVVVAAYKTKIRGSRATLSELEIQVDADDNDSGEDTGFTNCQIELGQRTDGANFETTAVDTSDFDLANYGSEVTSMDDTADPTDVQASKKLNVGDWLMIVRCDATTADQAYANGDQLTVELDNGDGNNISFDSGSTTSFPASQTQATLLTLRVLATQMAANVSADTTTRRLVSNSTNVVIGSYAITGPEQEGVNVSSVGVKFDGNTNSGIDSTNGCTTVGIADSNGTLLATSQNLAATTSVSTDLTFSTNFDVEKNEEFVLNVMCIQAGSSLLSTDVAQATALGSLSGTGLSSSQSFNATTTADCSAIQNALACGATVDRAASGSVSVTQGTNLPAQIIGPSEQLKTMTLSATAGSHEALTLQRFRIDLDTGAGATITDLKTMTVKAEGVTVAGVAAAAETTVCTRSITGTGTVGTDGVVTCTFSDGDVTLAAGQTGTFTVYLTGNVAGSIGTDQSPSAGGELVTDMDIEDDDTASVVDILFKGNQSKVDVYDTTADTEVTGRAVTPSAASVRVVKNSLPTTAISNPVNAVVALASLIVSGKNISLLEFSGLCNTGVTDLCNDAADDEVDLFVDNTLISGDVDVTAGAAAIFDLGTAVNIPVGTSEIKVTFTDAAGACDQSGESVHFTTSEFGYSVISKDDTNAQSFDTAGVGAFPVTVLADFNTYAGNIMTHQTIICG